MAAPIVAIRRSIDDPNTFCNGIRIDKEYVVTALHCHYDSRFVYDADKKLRAVKEVLAGMGPNPFREGLEWEYYGDILVLKTAKYAAFDKTVTLDDDGDYDFREVSIGFYNIMPNPRPVFNTVIRDEDDDGDYYYDGYHDLDRPAFGTRMQLVPNMKLTMLPREACVHSGRKTDHEFYLCSCTSIPARRLPYLDGTAWLLQTNFQEAIRATQYENIYEDTTGRLHAMLSYQLQHLPKYSLPVGFLRNPFHMTIGLKWRNVGRNKPALGNETTNEQLSIALLRKVQFTEQELKGFGMGDVGANDFIRSGAFYFKPVELKFGPSLTVISNGFVYKPYMGTLARDGVSGISGAPIFQKATVSNVFKFIGVLSSTPSRNTPIKASFTQVAHFADYIREKVNNDNFKIGQVSPFTKFTWQNKISYCPNVDCSSLIKPPQFVFGTLLCNYNILSYYKVCTTLPEICNEDTVRPSPRCGNQDCFDAYQFVAELSGTDIHFRPVFMDAVIKSFTLEEREIVGSYRHGATFPKTKDERKFATNILSLTLDMSTSAPFINRKTNSKRFIGSGSDNVICSASRLVDGRLLEKLEPQRYILRACYHERTDTMWMETRTTRSDFGDSRRPVLHNLLPWSTLEAPVKMHRFSMHSEKREEKFPYELNKINNLKFRQFSPVESPTSASSAPSVPSVGNDFTLPDCFY